MSPEIMLGLALAFMFATIIMAYNMGWQRGHDLHHSDDFPRPEGPPPTDRTLYQ